MKGNTKGAGVALFATAVLAGFGCSSDDNRHQFFDLDGDIYTEKFSCNKTFTGQPTTCPDFNQNDQIQFNQTGSNSWEAKNVPDTGFLIAGSFSGFDFHWTATSPNGYTESGTWTFSSNGNTFSGPSHYVANDDSYTGDCNTNGDIGVGSVTDPPAPIGCP